MVPHLWWQFPVYFQSIWISFIFVPALLLKKKRKKKSQILCAVWGHLEWRTRSPLSLSGSCPCTAPGGTWAKADSSTLQTCWPRSYAYLEKKKNKYTGSYLLRHRTSLPDRDLACTYKCHSLLPWLVGHRPRSAGAAALVPCQNGTHSPGTEPCRTP